MIEQQILEYYQEGNSIANTRKKFKKQYEFVSNILKENGVVAKSKLFERTNTFNEDYFRAIDTEARAYWLGFLYADGNVCLKGNRKRLQITVHEKDLDILENFKSAINYSGKLYFDRKIYRKIMVYSDKLVDDLIKLGCVPAKSLILTFPTEQQVPKHLQRHFIRGFYDGDGSVSIRSGVGYTVNFTSTSTFLSTLRNIIKEEANIEFSRFYPRYKEKENSAGSIFWLENVKGMYFFDYIYSDCTLYLERKFNKLNNFKNGITA